MGEVKKERTSNFECDVQLAQGPLQKRNFNDILCCILFLFNFVAIMSIGIYGLKRGHPDRLLIGYDSQDRPCGKDELADYPYVYLPAIGSIQRSICLKKCPESEIADNDSTTNSVNEDHKGAKSVWDKMEYKETTNGLMANNNKTPISKLLRNLKELDQIDSSNTTPTENQTKGLDANIIYALNVKSFSKFKVSGEIKSSDTNHVAVYQTKGYFGRVCLPHGKYQKEIIEKVGSAFGSNTTTLEKYISDLKTAWGIILGSVGIAVLIAMIYMVILRYFAGLITWLAILLYFSCILTLGILLLVKGKDKEQEGIEDNDKELQQDGKNLQYISYVVFAFTGLCAVLFLCIFNRIRLAIAIIKSAALFVGKVKTVFLVPPIITIFNMLFMAWWIVAFVFVYSVGDIQGSDKGPFASVKWEKNTRYFLLYHIFGGMWINAFFDAFIQFIIATACALWYFAEENNPHLPVYTGVKRGLTYHFGSLAFGSFVLALVQFIRFILQMIDQQMKKANPNQKANACVRYPMKCLQCLVECFQRFIEFLNKIAYIQMAIQGKNFCLSAKDAFQLILCNPVKFATIATIGNVFIFIGRLFIACITGLISYIVLIKVQYYKEDLFSPILPAVFCTIIGYFIGAFFMSVYGIGIDTILQCTCLDEQIMKKTKKDHNRCPDPLKEFFGVQEKKK